MEYYALNKPWGYVSARRDERFPTVMDFFPAEARNRLHPVGRLDKDTEGLIIITDDGRLDCRLLRPECHVEKTYNYIVLGVPEENKLNTLRSGADIGGEVTKKAVVTVKGTSTVERIYDYIPPQYREKLMKNPTAAVFYGSVTLTEGKTHQIRRMFRSVGCAVVYLRRVSIGGLTLSVCPDRGDVARLGVRELELLGYTD